MVTSASNRRIWFIVNWLISMPLEGSNARLLEMPLSYATVKYVNAKVWKCENVKIAAVSGMQ